MFDGWSRCGRTGIGRPASGSPGAYPKNLKDNRDALDEIARKVKDTRDRGFVHLDDQGRVVNRCENIAFAGGATDTNELCWTVVKTMAALGVVRHENVA